MLSGRWQIRVPYVTVSRRIFDGSGYGDYPTLVTQVARDIRQLLTLEYSGDP